MSATTGRLSVPSLLARGRRGIARYGWLDLSKEVAMRSVRPALGPAAARRLRHEAENVTSVNEILDLTFEFDAFGIGLRPYQARREFERLLEEVQRLRPKAMLEIGTANGGSLFALARVCASDAHIISVDLPNGAFGGGYTRWKIPLFNAFAFGSQRLDLIRDDSHASRTFDDVRSRLGGQMLDFLFIDGDHTYDGVRRDFELYEPLVRPGGIIAFHDIVPLDQGASPGINDPGEVPLFWRHLTASRDGKELIDPDGKGGFGIGLISVPL
jgi:predicted O-methyltransferase YrrM